MRKPDERAGVPATGWDPFQIMRQMLEWDPFQPLTPLAVRATYMPQFEVKETKDGYVFKADLPGVDEKEIDISLTGNRLTISGKREEEKKNEGETFFTFERSFGSFCRSFTLPDGVDGENIAAEMQNGVLMLRVPKKPEHQPRKISLQGVVDKVKDAIAGDGSKRAKA